MRKEMTLALLSVLFSAVWGLAGDGDDDLADSAHTGTETFEYLKDREGDLSTPVLNEWLKTTPVRTGQFQFRWGLADGSLWTDFVPSRTEFAIVTRWHIETDSFKGTGGRLEDYMEQVRYFYQDPQADKIDEMINMGSKYGLFDSPEWRALNIWFYAKVFEKNPDHLKEWVTLIQEKPLFHRTAVYQALWLADTEKSRELLQDGSFIEDERERKAVNQKAETTPPSILELEFVSPVNIQELWGAFYASGDAEYVKRVVSVLNWDEKTIQQDEVHEAIFKIAKLSLADIVSKHERVYEICERLVKEEGFPEKSPLHQLLKDARNPKSDEQEN